MSKANDDSPHVVALYQVVKESRDLNDPIVRRFYEQLKTMQPLQIKASVKEFYEHHLGVDPAGDSQTIARVQTTVNDLMEYRKIALSEKK